jgi:hypothetical protein
VICDSIGPASTRAVRICARATDAFNKRGPHTKTATPTASNTTLIVNRRSNRFLRNETSISLSIAPFLFGQSLAAVGVQSAGQSKIWGYRR